ncbi:unnamed protein product [Symbiodinium pilosum]|uniref:SET domain-containing protein n=1 Tax=Symbiodinium pilosum TaxID=2952 RepID=A0A812IMT3_SYMPI|nr:unnamed protein product [Symbiodinium pilosum]
MLLPRKNSKIVAIDAKACRRGNPLRYVNGARTAAQRRSINTKLVWRRKQVHFVTTKRVPANSEFIVDYGAGYWRGWAHNRRVDELQADIREARRRLASTGPTTSSRRRLAEAKEALEAFLEDSE